MNPALWAVPSTAFISQSVLRPSFSPLLFLICVRGSWIPCNSGSLALFQKRHAPTLRRPAPAGNRDRPPVNIPRLAPTPDRVNLRLPPAFSPAFLSLFLPCLPRTLTAPTALRSCHSPRPCHPPATLTPTDPVLQAGTSSCARSLPDQIPARRPRLAPQPVHKLISAPEAGLLVSSRAHNTNPPPTKDTH